MKRYDVEHTVWGDLSIVERSNGEWVKWDDVERLKSSHAELLKALKELYYTVQGEVPSLLDEDSDGNGYLDVEISNAIAKAEGTK